MHELIIDGAAAYGDSRNDAALPSHAHLGSGSVSRHEDRRGAGAQGHHGVDHGVHAAYGPQDLGSGCAPLQSREIPKWDLRGVQEPERVHAVRVWAARVRGAAPGDGGAQAAHGAHHDQLLLHFVS